MSYKEQIKEYFTGDHDEQSRFSRFLCAPYNVPVICYDIWSQKRGVFFRLDFPTPFRVLLIILMILSFPCWFPCFCCVGTCASIHDEWKEFDEEDFNEDEDPY
jgi:hypothetical protein